MPKVLLLFLLGALSLCVRAQDDPEFRKEFLLALKTENGLATNFHKGTDPSVMNLNLVPQLTLVEHHLRGGITAGLFYQDQRMQTLIGPSLFWKLKTLKASVFGSVANIQLSGEHLWGSRGQRLIGGGIHLDALNKITLGPVIHRDYSNNQWWFRFSVGYRLTKPKMPKEPFN